MSRVAEAAPWGVVLALQGVVLRARSEAALLIAVRR